MKIAIFEDNIDDIMSRYYPAFKRNELVVHYSFSGTLGEKEYVKDRLSSVKNCSLIAGIPRDKDRLPKADLYFSDGLDGECFGLLAMLPRERTFLYSHSPSIIEEAKTNGYRTILWPDQLERILEEFSPKPILKQKIKKPKRK